MKKLLALILCLCMLLCAVPAAIAEEGDDLPELHTIPADNGMGTTEDENGADAYGNALDHADSRYYVMNDYYNMVSAGSLHILPHFETYQQTTEYSCGCASAGSSTCGGRGPAPRRRSPTSSPTSWYTGSKAI